MDTLKPEARDSGIFLRWQGSKRRTSADIAKLIPSDAGRYVEPFLGSGAVFFAQSVQEAHLSDALGPLVNTYHQLKTDHVGLDLEIRRVSRAYSYVELRTLSATAFRQNDATSAAIFLVLNGRSFNGLFRTNRDGRFNVPEGARVPGPPALAKLEIAATRLASAHVHCLDAFDVLAECRPRDFVYLDPPYPSPRRQTFGEYGYHNFGSSEWSHLISDVLPQLDRIGATFALSMPNDKDLLAKFTMQVNSHSFSTSYRLGGNGSRVRHESELIVSNVEVA